MRADPKKLRQIYDNIYGFIDFSRGDFDFILKNPFFLRLHNLKQMGLAYYVYPNALHTRYAHSLGVYANVCKIIDSQSRFAKKIPISKDDRYKIQISALLHDIGHLPLSHTIEAALERFDVYEKSVKNKKTVEFSAKSLFSEGESGGEVKNERVAQNVAVPRVALHEHMGEAVLRYCGIAEDLKNQKNTCL